MANQVNPAFFQFGNAFAQGREDAQQNRRRNAMLDLEQRQQGLVERRFAQDEQARAAQGEQQARNRAIYAQLFQEAGLDPGLAETDGADELAAHLLAQKTAPPAKPKLIEDRTGRLVPEAEGVMPYHAPQGPKAPGTLYQVVGPDGKPRYVTADQALGQQPFLKSDVPQSVPDPAAQATDAANVLAAIGNAKSLIGWNTTGYVGQKLGEMGGTDAYDLRASLDTVKASIGFDRLQRMREESKTGGALGAIAVRELDLLQATIASLDANQSGAQLAKNLDRVQAQYEKAMNAYQTALGGAPSGQPTRPGQQTSGAYADPDKEARYQAWKKAQGGG